MYYILNQDRLDFSFFFKEVYLLDLYSNPCNRILD